MRNNMNIHPGYHTTTCCELNKRRKYLAICKAKNSTKKKSLFIKQEPSNSFYTLSCVFFCEKIDVNIYGFVYIVFSNYDEITLKFSGSLAKCKSVI